MLTLGVDGAGNVSGPTSYVNASPDPERPGVDEWHLYADGTELPQQSLIGKPGILPFYVLPTDRGGLGLAEELPVDFLSRLKVGGFAVARWGSC